MTNKEAIEELMFLSKVENDNGSATWPIVSKPEQVEALKLAIKALKSKRPRGEWNEWTDDRWGGTTIYCPYCKENALEEYRDGLLRQVKSNFCPNCGAKIGGATDGY